MSTGKTMKDVGRVAYEAYCASTGGVSAVSGQPLPAWAEQSATIQRAWIRAAGAVIDDLGDHPERRTHEPIVSRFMAGDVHEPDRFTVEWPAGEPGPGDVVLMSAQLFQQSIDVLNGDEIS